MVNDDSRFLHLDEKMDKIAERILSGIQRVESQYFQGKDLVFMNMNAKDITDIPIPTVPSLIYFKNGDPEVYPDNLMNEATISTWIKNEFESNKEVIEDLSAAQVKLVLENEQFAMVMFTQKTIVSCATKYWSNLSPSMMMLRLSV